MDGGRGMRVWAPAIGGVLAAVLALGACTLGGSSGSKEKEQQVAKSTVTPQKALLSLTPDVSSALEAAMPGIEVDQMVEDDTQCGGSDWLDSKDASKIVKSASLEAVGGASDRRSLSDLVGEATAYLEGKGWVVQAGQGAEGDVSKSMTKKGLSGRVHIEAQTFRLSSGKDVPILTATVITDCLPNPDYQES